MLQTTTSLQQDRVCDCDLSTCEFIYYEPGPRRSSEMSIPPADLDRVTRLLRSYFDNDLLKRFDFEQCVGKGANAIAWKIKYKPSEETVLEHIVLKMERYVAFFDDDAMDASPGRRDADYITPPDDNEMDMDDDEPDMWNNPIKNEERWLKVRETCSLNCKGGGTR